MFRDKYSTEHRDWLDIGSQVDAWPAEILPLPSPTLPVPKIECLNRAYFFFFLFYLLSPPFHQNETLELNWLVCVCMHVCTRVCVCDINDHLVFLHMLLHRQLPLLWWTEMPQNSQQTFEIPQSSGWILKQEKMQRIKERTRDAPGYEQVLDVLWKIQCRSYYASSIRLHHAGYKADQKLYQRHRGERNNGCSPLGETEERSLDLSLALNCRMRKWVRKNMIVLLSTKAEILLGSTLGAQS